MLNPSFHREEYKKKKNRLFLKKVGIFLFFVVLLYVGLVFLSRIDRFRISNIDFVGGLLISPDKVKEESKTFLSGNYFWFFPKNNIFLYPHDELEDFLKEQFKRIDTISISSINNQSIKITIKERGMYALWCKDLSEGDFEKCYFMDNNGVIFSEAPIFSGDAYFKYYGLLANDVNPVGLSYIASTTEFYNLSSFIERVKNTNLRPANLIAKGNNQFDLTLSDGGKIYLDNILSFSKMADNLDVLLQKINSSTTSKEIQIDYIDLRFGNKLFYKLK